MVFYETFILWAKEFIINFSYLAVFLLSIIGTSTVFIPFPIYIIIFFAAGLGMNPLLVGIVAGLGSAIGELTGYLIGIGGRRVIEGKKENPPKIVRMFTKLFKRFGFAVIALTSFLPFPFDFIGILSGVSNYDIKKFYVATALGKIAKCVLIAYAGYVGVPLIEQLIEWLKTVI